MAFRFKKWGVLFLAAVTAATLLSACGGGSVQPEGPTEGSCGESLNWSYDKKTGALTISGSGEMTSYPWKDLEIKSLTIEDGCTSICEDAFAWQSNLSGDIIIPDSVKTIEKFAFGFAAAGDEVGCLKLPSGLTRIEDYAFDRCRFTGELVIPEGVTYIGEDAFEDACFSGALVLPEGLETIGTGAFIRNENLTGDLTLPDSVTSIGTYAFAYCGNLNGKLTLSASLTEIPNYSFQDCGFTGDLSIPEGVTKIGDCAFAYGKFAGTLTLPESLSEVGARAFSQNIFAGELHIPKQIEIIGVETFYCCNGFSSLKLEDGLVVIGNGAFERCTGLSGELVIPDSVQVIGKNAFANDENFSGSLSLSKQLTAIENGAFLNCSGLTGELKIPEKVVNIGESAFEDCSGLTGALIIPDATVVIGDEAFSSCTGLTEATFGRSLRSIGKSAFAESGLQMAAFHSDIVNYYEGREENPSFPGNCRLSRVSSSIEEFAMQPVKKVVDEEGDDLIEADSDEPFIWSSRLSDTFVGIGSNADLLLEPVDGVFRLSMNGREWGNITYTTDDYSDVYEVILTDRATPAGELSNLILLTGVDSSNYLTGTLTHSDGSTEEIVFAESWNASAASYVSSMMTGCFTEE